jgi:antitoxin PrlF
MGVESKITTKGQTTIPIEVREYLKVGAGDRIGYEFVDGKVVLVPKNRSALDFAGVLFEPDREPVSVEAMNEAIGESVSDRCAPMRWMISPARPETMHGPISKCSSKRRGGARARRSIMCCSHGPPGLGKTTLAQIVSRELGVGFRMTSGAGDRQGRRSGGDPDQSRRSRRAVHRRDPPAQPGGRGNPLPGDGGFPARPRHRRGTGGALGEDRPVQRFTLVARPRGWGC